MTPSAVDELTRKRHATLAQFRRVIPKAYCRPSAFRSWWTLIRVLISIAACVFGIYSLELHAIGNLFWRIPALVVLWVIYGWVLVALFVIGHDCGHNSFSTRHWINTLVGHFCMSPLGNGFHAWKLTHNQHHAHTQLRGHEVDWASFLRTREDFHSSPGKRSWITRLGYALPFGIALWVGWNTIRRGYMIRTLLSRGQFNRERRPLIVSGAVMTLVLVAIYGGLWYGVGFWGMAKFFGIPAIIANVTGSVIIAIQHANEHSLLYEREHWTPCEARWFRRLMSASQSYWSTSGSTSTSISRTTSPQRYPGIT
jgi:acyl-lipid omega-6 desaturase (Delta-12 desaturase)